MAEYDVDICILAECPNDGLDEASNVFGSKYIFSKDKEAVHCGEHLVREGEAINN